MPENKSNVRSSRNAELRIGVVCISMDPNSREALEGLVPQVPGAFVVDNVDPHVTPREAAGLLEPFQHGICLINFDDGVEEGCRIAERLRDGCGGNVSIFAASSNAGADQIIRAMRSGCSEYLIKPFQATQVLDALAHVEARRHSKVQGQKGQIITLMGAKGGVGVTSLGLHLALNLVQRHQQRCLVVDQHATMGHASLYLGLSRHQYSFYELTHNTDRLDTDLLQGFLLQHPSGLDVLDAPEAIDAFPHTPPEAIEQTLAFLAENYQFVIVDSPPGLSEETCGAIRQSDRLEIIITAELASIRNAIRAIEYLTGLHYPPDRIDVVLNRYSKRSGVGESEIEAALHRQITVKIPNSYLQFVNATNAGTPIEFGTKSGLPQAFDMWADRLMRDESAAVKADKSPRKFLSLFGS
jgi:pilus assembly protein CpaE